MLSLETNAILVIIKTWVEILCNNESVGKLKMIILRYYIFFDRPERPPRRPLLRRSFRPVKECQSHFFFIAQRVIIWYFVFTFSLAFIKLWYKLHIFSFPHTQNVVGFSLRDKTFHNIWDSMLMTHI